MVIKKKVAIFGSVGLNRGDDLMNRVLVNFFCNHGFDVESASMRPEVMSEKYGNKYFSSRVIHLYEWIAAIWRSNFVVIGGGTVIQDDFGKLLGGILTYTSLVILISKLMGKKVHVIGVGINEINRSVSKILINTYRLADTVCVRDENSIVLANKYPWLKRKLSFSPDLAFLKDFYTPTTREFKEDYKESRLLISLVGESHKESAYAVLLQTYSICKSNGVNVVGIAMDERESEEISIFRKFKETHPDFSFIVPDTAEEAVSEIANANGVISMRLHASIISLVLDKPLLVVSRESKTAWIKDWIKSQLFVNVQDVNSIKMQVAIEDLIQQTESWLTNKNTSKLQLNAGLVSAALNQIS